MMDFGIPPPVEASPTPDTIRSVVRRAPANAVRMSRKARMEVARLVVQRMFVLAEEIAQDGSDHVRWEEFVALAYQLRLVAPPPDAEVQSRLDARGLLLRRFEDPEPDPTDDEIEKLTRRDA